MARLAPISGVVPALFTPFDAHGEVSPAAIRSLVAYQLAAGVSGFFVCGGTGEGLLLSGDERRLVLETAVAAVAGRVPVIAHVGAPATRTSVELARHAADAGADAVASILPPFGAPDIASATGHFIAIGEATPLPLYVYAIGARDPLGLLRALLAACPTLRGVKFTSDDLFTMGQMLDLEGPDGERLNVLSGRDEVAVGGLAMGADGLIGTTYNLLPGVFVRLYEAMRRGDVAEARRLQRAANRVIEVLVRGNPLPRFKAALGLLGVDGLDAGSARLPARPLSPDDVAALARDLRAAGLEGLVALGEPATPAGAGR